MWIYFYFLDNQYFKLKFSKFESYAKIKKNSMQHQTIQQFQKKSFFVMYYI